MRVLVVALGHQRVLMGIDHSGHQRRSGQLDDDRLRGKHRSVDDRADVFTVDQNDCIRPGLRRAPIDDAIRYQCDRLRCRALGADREDERQSAQEDSMLPGDGSFSDTARHGGPLSGGERLAPLAFKSLCALLV